ncbi:MAG TPA: alkene reductase [Bacteroidales bacterium]|nr:alkene reductase [Bacteroidales bacterium]
MKSYKLFTSYHMGRIALNNRIVMSPMTRSRAINNIPNDLMAEYYGQRSGAGLIITEGTSPSPNGLGYCRIPGIFSPEQVEGWKKVTTSVHKGGARIFVQLMHTGRVGHKLNLPEGAELLAPSALKPDGQIWTDVSQMQDYQVPGEMNIDDIIKTRNEFVRAAKNAIAAGFDGVELHAANGYLLEQFLCPSSNIRKDNYGGSIENRSRFVLETVKSVSDAIGKEKTAIRISPYGVSNGLQLYPEIDATYKYLAEKLNSIGIAYIHIVDHSSMGAPVVSHELKKEIRKIFKNTLILSGGYDVERAESDIKSGHGDLIAFGRPFISNPDLPERLLKSYPLVSPDMATFYTPGSKGYTDYPVYKA